MLGRGCQPDSARDASDDEAVAYGQAAGLGAFGNGAGAVQDTDINVMEDAAGSGAAGGDDMFHVVQ